MEEKGKKKKKEPRKRSPDDSKEGSPVCLATRESGRRSTLLFYKEEVDTTCEARLLSSRPTQQRALAPSVFSTTSLPACRCVPRV